MQQSLQRLQNWFLTSIRIDRAGSFGWPWLDRWLVHCRNLGSLHRRALAGGIALGLFIGLTPTVGIQTVLIVIGAAILRVNLPSALAACWITNPLTAPLIYWGAHRIGAGLFADHFPVEAFSQLAPSLQTLIQQSAYLWAGCLVLASSAALIGYTAYIGTRRYCTIRRWQRRAQRLNRS